MSFRMNRAFRAYAMITAVLLFASAARANDRLLIITGAVVSTDGTTLFVSGTGFTNVRAVTLGGVVLGGVSATANTLTGDHSRIRSRQLSARHHRGHADPDRGLRGDARHHRSGGTKGRSGGRRPARTPRSER